MATKQGVPVHEAEAVAIEPRVQYYNTAWLLREAVLTISIKNLSYFHIIASLLVRLDKCKKCKMTTTKFVVAIIPTL